MKDSKPINLVPLTLRQAYEDQLKIKRENEENRQNERSKESAKRVSEKEKEIEKKKESQKKRENKEWDKRKLLCKKERCKSSIFGK